MSSNRSKRYSRVVPLISKLTAIDRRISRWLNGFVGLDVVDLCYHAYDQRKAPELKEITRRGRLTDSGSNQINGICTSLRHYLGRLSHHIRASKQVIEDGRRLSVLFDPGASRVEAIPVVNSVSRPMADGLTQPLSMLNRMIRQENPLRGHYEEALESMDRQFGLGVRISEQYQSKTFRPLVHAEVQVLEYFHFGKRAFVEKDRYIGTSKPACYCCYLYFRSHPLKCATSRSHQNIWLNWGPPLLAEGAADERYLHQRNILNSMLETIRDDALDQISQKAAAPLSHLDSTTGITPSVLSIQGASRNDDFHWIDNQLGNLSIGESQWQCHELGLTGMQRGLRMETERTGMRQSSPTIHLLSSTPILLQAALRMTWDQTKTMTRGEEHHCDRVDGTSAMEWGCGTETTVQKRERRGPKGRTQLILTQSGKVYSAPLLDQHQQDIL